LESGNTEQIGEKAEWRTMLQRFENTSSQVIPKATSQLRAMSKDMREGRMENLSEKAPCCYPHQK